MLNYVHLGEACREGDMWRCRLPANATDCDKHT